MRNQLLGVLAACGAALWGSPAARADNPLILDQFTADPSARVFNGRMYLYPSHDIRATPGRGRPNWFCMEDYHVFSSDNLLDWHDHGMIVSQTTVPWADPTAYSMWAPDCAERGGKFYFYFPAQARRAALPTTAATTTKATAAARRGNGGGGFRVGVAVADSPAGPFVAEPKPIDGVAGIDPCVFTDRDGQAYIYYAMGRIWAAKLKADMLGIDGDPQVIRNLPARGLIEGPFTFERNGIYYLTFPHVQSKTERLEYAMAKSPLGPFTWAGVIMDESPSGCWTNHHSIVEYKGQWYLFYHDNDLSPDFDKNRSVRADYLTFNDGDGTIRKVVPTLRGVGVRDAREMVQVDRYTGASRTGTAVSFVDNGDHRLGWQVTFAGPAAWVRYDRVDFGTGGLAAVDVRSRSPAGGTIEIRLDKIDAPPLARVDIGKGETWGEATSGLLGPATGLHDLFVSSGEGANLSVDWVRFH